jgi:hypothetical protein
LFEANETRTPRLRNFDTELPSSYCYEFRSDNRLESVANVHTAADLHVRPDSQIALIRRILGAANVQRDTSCLISRNENDSTQVPAKSTPPSQNRAMISTHRGNALNLRGNSKRKSAVTFRTIAQNKFINRLRLSRAGWTFPTRHSRYADK